MQKPPSSLMAFEFVELPDGNLAISKERILQLLELPDDIADTPPPKLTLTGIAAEIERLSSARRFRLSWILIWAKSKLRKSFSRLLKNPGIPLIW